MSQGLVGTSLTVAYHDGRERSVVVTAARPEAVRQLLDACLVDTQEVPPFIRLEPVDIEGYIYLRTEHIAEIYIEPEVLADLNTPAGEEVPA